MLDFPELFAPARIVSGRISRRCSSTIDLKPDTVIAVIRGSRLDLFRPFDELFLAMLVPSPVYQGDASSPLPHPAQLQPAAVE